MADRKTDRDIKKLRRCIEEVEGLDPSKVQYKHQSVKDIASNIGATLADVFGKDSQEYEDNRLLLFPTSLGNMDEAQETFPERITHTAKRLEGLIEGLEEKREDLEAEQKVDQSGAPSSDDPTLQTTEGHCPRCGPDRIAYILASERYEDEEELTSNSGGPSMTVTFMFDYLLLRCRGCNVPYFQRNSSDTEGWEYRSESWPLPAKRKKPDWVHKLDDQSLRDLLEEIYGALDANHRVLAAIGIRTALDQTMEPEGVDPTLPFKEKLNELQKKGVLAENDKQIFSKLIDAGSAAAHRDWKPAQEELTTLFEGMENYLQRVLVLKNTVGKIDVPPKQKRPKKDKTSPES